MIELSRKAQVAIARRLREYAHFLRNNTSYTELGEYEWDFPIACTEAEILIHLETIVDDCCPAA